MNLWCYIGEYVLTLIFKVMLLLRILNVVIRPIYFLIPLLTILPYRLIIRNQTISECEGFSSMVANFIRVSKILTLVFVILKVDIANEWDWGVVFWPIWCCICILSLVSLGILLLFLGSVCSCLNNETTIDEVISTGWLLYVLAGGIACVSVFFYGLAAHLDLEED